MKAKYLFYSLALASAFTACTQDELFDAPALESNDAAGRPVAGVVTFVNGDVDSRYNRQDTGFETGDKMGIYLMDEFSGYGEKKNANETLWQWQSCWWNMYNMVDYIHTNYSYEYNGETEEWVNRASRLNEGNYIALFPQNKVATNRRDLWHPIKGEVDLVDHTEYARYYVNRDNQFFVGYEQIMRDQNAEDEEGNLTANISMKPIMTYAKFAFENVAANDFKIKKVVFKLRGGLPLPNVAYVKPSKMLDEKTITILNKQDKIATAPWWAFDNAAYMKDGKVDECGKILAWSKYDRKTFTQDAARDIVQYASTVDGRIPYGMTDEQAAPIYEYVFNFPADADILYGTGSKEADTPEDRTSKISIALPAFGKAPVKGDNNENEGRKRKEHYSYYWKDMEVIVYGEYYDPNVSAYRPGIIRKIDGNDNATFGLDQMALWKMGMEIPMGTVVVDDDYFYQLEEIRVSNTADLINLLNARLSSSQTADEDGKIMFEIYSYGDKLEITDDVIKVIKDYEKRMNNEVDVVLNFKRSGSYKTPTIVLKAENCIDEFIYDGVNVEVAAAQTITDEAISGINDLNNFSTLTIKAATKATSLTVNGMIVNEKNSTINVESATLTAESDIENHGTITLKNATVNADEVKNESVLETSSTSPNATIIDATVKNLNTCLNCGSTKAQLTIKSIDTYIEELINYDNVTVESGATLATEFDNKGYIKVEGTIIVNGESTNAAKIDVAENAEVEVESPATLENTTTGEINVWGELKENIENTGYIYVKNYGHVIVNGGLNADGVAGIIDVTEAAGDINANAAKDIDPEGRHNYFRYDVLDEDTAKKLDASLKARISTQNYTGANGWEDCRIIVRWMPERTTATRFLGIPSSNIVHVDINKDLNIETNSNYEETGFTTLADVNWAVAYWIFNTDKITANQVTQHTPALTIASGVTVQVDNDATFRLAEQMEDFDETFTYKNGNNTITVTQEDALNVKVYGKFKANNSSKVLGNVVVSGTGIVEIDNNNDEFTWVNWNIPAMNWDGK